MAAVGSGTVRVDLDGPVAYLTLDRPEVLNAVSVALLEDLEQACRAVADRPSVRVVVLAGAGRTFSAGTDLAMLDTLLGDERAAQAAAAAGDRAASALEALEAVTVAAIHGRCVGGGLGLALACDLRLAGDTARFSFPEVDLGIPLGGGAIPRLLREVGPGLARDLLLSCREFDAVEARTYSIVSRVVPSDDLDIEVAALAGELASRSLAAVRPTLAAIAAHVGVGVPVGWADAGAVLAAVRDPESRAVRARRVGAPATDLEAPGAPAEDDPGAPADDGPGAPAEDGPGAPADDRHDPEIEPPWT